MAEAVGMIKYHMREYKNTKFHAAFQHISENHVNNDRWPPSSRLHKIPCVIPHIPCTSLVSAVFQMVIVIVRPECERCHKE